MFYELIPLFVNPFSMRMIFYDLIFFFPLDISHMEKYKNHLLD